MWSPVGSTSHPTQKKKLCGLHVDSTWSPVEFMWSRGVHEESMGQGKVHEKAPKDICHFTDEALLFPHTFGKHISNFETFEYEFTIKHDILV